MRRAFAFAASVAALTFAACSSSPSASTCSDYQPPFSFDALHPAVSFTGDVMPIFTSSCAFSTCHGTEGDNNGVFLGSDRFRVHAGIVGVRSSTLPEMALVRAGDPHESFLMRKIDGSHCVLSDRCTGKTCGESMPRGENLMPVETRDVIRRWIAQGAKND